MNTIFRRRNQSRMQLSSYQLDAALPGYPILPPAKRILSAPAVCQSSKSHQKFTRFGCCNYLKPVIVCQVDMNKMFTCKPQAAPFQRKRRGFLHDTI